uniref:Metalloendopeptidase n=1 Tax=Steinernema glaseri TaxID=37863 RepID=A0A1I7ZN67_9BILA
MYYQGCYTNVGRVPGRNVVMLEANSQATCVEHDIVIHELFHTIGLWHEHMRYDRDDYIKVHYENIEQMYFSQFAKVPKGESDTFGVEYDYRSVMHYAKDAFAMRKNLVSMETLDSQFQEVIGKVADASPSDYKKICTLYECRVCRGENSPTPPPKLADTPVTKGVPPEAEVIPLVPECSDKFPTMCEATIGSRSRDFVCALLSVTMKSWCCGSCSAAPVFEPLFRAA